MKTKSLLTLGAALAAVIFIALNMNKAGAQGRQFSPVWTVILTGGDYIQGTVNQGVGLFVVNVSASSSAPAIKIGDSLAEDLTMLQERGGRVTVHNNAWGPLVYTITSGITIN